MIAAPIDFLQIRLDNDLSAVVEKYLGPPKSGKWRCPFHNDKTPSFSVKGERYKCFGSCGATGDVVDFVATMEKINLKDAAHKLGGYLLDLGLTPEQVKAKQAEIRAENARRELERKAEEQARRGDALKRVGEMAGLVERYHSQVESARLYWRSQGLNDGTISRYKLGYCPECPTYQQSASYVIPYYHAGNLISIRHRLATPNGSGKYRPEIAGLPAAVFNADVLDSGDWMVVLVEGEVKAMVLNQAGFSAVGIPGANSFKDKWLKLFKPDSVVYVALDPGAEVEAREIATQLVAGGIEARVCTLPVKPDDMLVRYGGSPADLVKFLELGKKVY